MNFDFSNVDWSQVRGEIEENEELQNTLTFLASPKGQAILPQNAPQSREARLAGVDQATFDAFLTDLQDLHSTTSAAIAAASEQDRASDQANFQALLSSGASEEDLAEAGRLSTTTNTRFQGDYIDAFNQLASDYGINTTAQSGDSVFHLDPGMFAYAAQPNAEYNGTGNPGVWVQDNRTRSPSFGEIFASALPAVAGSIIGGAALPALTSVLGSTIGGGAAAGGVGAATQGILSGDGIDASDILTGGLIGAIPGLAQAGANALPDSAIDAIGDFLPDFGGAPPPTDPNIIMNFADQAVEAGGTMAGDGPGLLSILGALQNAPTGGINTIEVPQAAGQVETPEDFVWQLPNVSDQLGEVQLQIPDFTLPNNEGGGGGAAGGGANSNSQIEDPSSQSSTQSEFEEEGPLDSGFDMPEEVGSGDTVEEDGDADIVSRQILEAISRETNPDVRQELIREYEVYSGRTYDPDADYEAPEEAAEEEYGRGGDLTTGGTGEGTEENDSILSSVAIVNGNTSQWGNGAPPYWGTGIYGENATIGNSSGPAYNGMGPDGTQADAGTDAGTRGDSGSGNGNGNGNDDGDGNESGSGGGAGGGAGGVSDAEWGELFPYTKLTPAQKTALLPHIDYIRSIRG